jgi:hypothetical protein
MNNNLPKCPICGINLSFTLARGRKSGKPFVMLRCPGDGRHFRGFISHRPYVEQVLTNLETMRESSQGSQTV